MTRIFACLIAVSLVGACFPVPDVLDEPDDFFGTPESATTITDDPMPPGPGAVETSLEASAAE